MLRRKHVIVLGAYAATAAVLFTFRKPIMQWMEADQAWYYDVLVGLAGLAIAFVPAQFFNAYASLTRMSGVHFLFGTIAGKIPYMFAVSLIGSQFANDAGLLEYLAIASGYALFLTLVYGIYRFALHVRVK